MKKIILGLVIGLTLGTIISITFAALGNRIDNEFNKFTTDVNGDTAVLIKIVQ